MPEPSERRRSPRQAPEAGGESAWVTLENVPGRSGEVKAKVVDVSAGGLGIRLPFWLRDNDVILIKGLTGATNPTARVKARVVRCGATSDGAYMAGIAYEDGYQPPQQKDTESPPDYYELLQVSQNADPELIHRVYRLLAQRYHPDNTVTGDENRFRDLTDGYKVLSDPEKRAAYDVHLQSYRQNRWRLFDTRQAAVGKMAEKSKRRGILELLYTTRQSQPSAPTLNLNELETLLGCPKEHLEFSLWYLKENGLVQRADNGRYAVTAKGVDYAEEQEMAETSQERLLPAARDSEQRTQ